MIAWIPAAVGAVAFVTLYRRLPTALELVAVILGTALLVSRWAA